MIHILGILLLVGILIKLFIPELTIPIKSNSKKIILDSCALIDGRILDLAQAKFITSQLVVPDFVIHELQLLADGTDAHKRERARFGLDVVKELQANDSSTTVVNNDSLPSGLPTDDKLVVLAKKLRGQLYTTDYNLQKVAEIANVDVLNVNDLAQKLRPVALPGEQKVIKILQKGSNPKQGVGYLEDGTMLVIENGARAIGKTVKVEVTRTHQTVSGKMLFGELVGLPETKSAQKSSVPERTLPQLRKPSSKRDVVARRFRSISK